MEITIGIQNVSREIVIESALSASQAATIVSDALIGLRLELTDIKGKVVVVPTSAIAYVEIGSEERTRVGFGTI